MVILVVPLGHHADYCGAKSKVCQDSLNMSDSLEDFQLNEYGTKFYVAFLHARIIATAQLLGMCEVVARLPRRRGRTYCTLWRRMQPSLEIVTDTLSKEIKA